MTTCQQCQKQYTSPNYPHTSGWLVVHGAESSNPATVLLFCGEACLVAFYSARAQKASK